MCAVALLLLCCCGGRIAPESRCDREVWCEARGPTARGTCVEPDGRIAYVCCGSQADLEQLASEGDVYARGCIAQEE